MMNMDEDKCLVSVFRCSGFEIKGNNRLDCSYSLNSL